MPRQPAGARSSKPLSVGLSATAHTILPVQWYVSVSDTNTGGPLYVYAAISVNFATAFIDVQINPTGAGGGNLLVPTTNDAGIAPPATAPAATAVVGPTLLPAGTYNVGYGYHNPLGYSFSSPTIQITVDGTEFIQVPQPPLPTTAPATVELIVPNLEDWHVTRYAIMVASHLNEPTCEVYVDAIRPFSLLDATALGSRNSANGDLYFRPGQRLIAKWAGADIGAQCTFSVYGEKTS